MRRCRYLFVLALRLLWPRRSWMRVVAVVCVLGVALGTMLQIVVRGVMDGMVEEIDRGVSACVPPLLVSSAELTRDAVAEMPGVRGCKEVVMGQGLVNGESCRYATWGDSVRNIAYLTEGTLLKQPNDALLSKVFAEKLGLDVGKTVVLCSQNGQVYHLHVCGVFRVPGRMLVPDLITEAPIEGHTLLAIEPCNDTDADAVLRQLQTKDASVQRLDGTGDTEGWLNMIAKVKRVMGIILYLVVLIAAFATGGMVFVICLTHRRAVAVMRAFGATPRQTRLVFLFQGGMIATIGSALGVLLGFLVLQYRMQVQDTLRVCGLDAFPTQVLDMELPSLAPVSLYIAQGVVAWCLVMFASVMGAVLASRFCRLR